MGKLLIVFLFLVGVAATALLVVWVVALVLFVFGDSPHPGAIAYIPKEIFTLSVFVFFHRTRPVKRFFEKLEKYFF